MPPKRRTGDPTGPEIHARARLLEHGSPEDRHAARPLRHKYPFMQGVLVPLSHKLMRARTLHYEVRPAAGTPPRKWAEPTDR